MIRLSRLLPWLKKWWWIGLLTTIIIAVVAVAYLLSDSATVNLLDGVGTAGTLLLSALLLYIYDRQNEILERQEKIFEEQLDIQEAAEVQVRPHIESWNLGKGDEFTISLKNTGEGDIYDLSAVTRVDFPNRENLHGGESKSLLARHTDSNQINAESILQYSFWIDQKHRRGNIKRVLRKNWYKLKTLLRSDTATDTAGYDSGGFRDLSREVCKYLRDQGVTSTIDIEVTILIEYTDARGESSQEEIIESDVDIKGESDLVSTLDSLNVRDRRSRVRIKEMEMISEDRGPFSLPEDSLHLEFQNKGEVVGHLVRAVSIIRTDDDCEFPFSGKSLEPFGQSGFEVHPGRDAELLILPVRFSHIDGEDTRTITFKELVQEMINQELTQSVSIRLQCVFQDPAHNQEITEFYLMDSFSVIESDQDIIQITEPTSLSESGLMD